MFGNDQLESVALDPYYYWGFGDDLVFRNHGRIRWVCKPHTGGVEDAFGERLYLSPCEPVIGALSDIWAGKTVQNPRLHAVGKIDVGCGSVNSEFPHLEFD